MYISIEGNIGSGKSTLAKALAKELKATYLPERFEENVLLPLFYKDKKTFAFPTEYSFLIDRHKQLVNYFKGNLQNKITVSDFHFDKCLCFAKTNLRNSDFLFFKKHFKALQKSVKQPQLIIYIETDIKQVVANIKQRGREVEKNIDTDYLQSLKKTLDYYYFSKLKKGNKIMILNITEYNKKTLGLCIKQIKANIN